MAAAGRGDAENGDKDGGVLAGDQDDEDDYYVSDAEALLACWSFLKWRRRLGSFDPSPASGTSRAPPGDDGDDDGNDDPNRKERRRMSRGPSLGAGTNSNGYTNFFLLEGEELDGENDSDPSDDDDDDNSRGDNKIKKSTKWEFEDESAFEDDDEYDEYDADDEYDAEDDDDMGGGGAFTSFPSGPSGSALLRSEALKRVWEDPDYRRRWHQRRWGGTSSSRRRDGDGGDAARREQKAERRARALPAGFLGSDELASLTEEEIASAIRTRVRSTRKRVASRDETLRRRREDLAASQRRGELSSLSSSSPADADDGPRGEERPTRPAPEPPRLARDVLFTLSRDELEARQRLRSERAKRLYATRLANERRAEEETRTTTTRTTRKKKNAGPSSNGGEGIAAAAAAAAAGGGRARTTAAQRRADASAANAAANAPRPFFPPQQLSPRDALLRVRHALDLGRRPAVDDVRLVLQPAGLKHRKGVLVRILGEVFDLRGKCVPVRRGDSDGGTGDDDENGSRRRSGAAGTDGEYEFVTHAKIGDLGDLVMDLLQKEEGG